MMQDWYPPPPLYPSPYTPLDPYQPLNPNIRLGPLWPNEERIREIVREEIERALRENDTK